LIVAIKRQNDTNANANAHEKLFHNQGKAGTNAVPVMMFFNKPPLISGDAGGRPSRPSQTHSGRERAPAPRPAGVDFGNGVMRRDERARILPSRREWRANRKHPKPESAYKND
jgi:hypothetical protein